MNAMTKIMIAALLVASAIPALAEQGATRAEKREARQAARIEKGVESGRLTEQEAARLEKGQAHVDNLESRVAADGTVTAQEKAHVKHAQDVQSRKIARQKHDAQHDLNHDGKNDHRKK